MPQRAVQRLAAMVPEDLVAFWLRRLDDDTRAGAGYLPVIQVCSLGNTIDFAEAHLARLHSRL